MAFQDTAHTVAESIFCPCNSSSTTTFDNTNNEEWLESSFDHSSSSKFMSRFLADDDENVPWEIAVVTITIAIMFFFMITDLIYPDWVMLGGLMVFFAAQIITVKEALAGFSNEGILTVLALFVVAEGLSRTGALDYYMGKILGRPKTIAGAQIRLMVPIVCISAFFNNTPIVAIMIPVTLRWSKLIGCPKQQLLIPLSYATILGGTCTLVGTSTNLVVNGLLEDKYPDEPAGNIQLFDLAVYGVPNAFIGVIYMLCCGTLILPGGRNKIQGGDVSLTTGEYDDLLIGARVLPYSPAAGRTVKRSGLNNIAGIYLVNVRRATTGNIHRAVSPDFVVSVGDELYFTGNVEEFSAFCEAHGLEILTAENIDDNVSTPTSNTKVSKVDETERLQLLNRISDQISGSIPVEPGPRPSQVIVTRDAYHTDLVVLVAVDCVDRPGLLADISEALFQQAHLQIKHSEANVLEGRSLSVWRCETITNQGTSDAVDTDTDESSLLDSVWNVVCNVLPDVADTNNKSGSTSLLKGNSVQVVRAVITQNSSFIGKKPIEIDIGIATPYKAAIVAYQKSSGKNAGLDAEFDAGDILVLAVQESSLLLQVPPADFYHIKKGSKRVLAIENDIEHNAGTIEVWNNLRVLLNNDSASGNSLNDTPKGEFLTAFTIPRNSPLNGKTLGESGYAKLPGVVLVSIERPVVEKSKVEKGKDNASDFTPVLPEEPLKVGDLLWFSGSAEAIAELQRINGIEFYQDSSTSIIQDRRLVQAVVARASPLIGRTVIDVDFRTVYGGVVLAVQRGSERVHEHPGFVKLQTGDVLLIEADMSFVKNNSRNYKVFALVSEVKDSAPPRPQMFFVCLVLILAAFAVSAIESLDQSLFMLSSIVGIIMATLGVLTQQEARDAIQWDLFVVVASAFGVSSAMTNSGVAKGLAKFLVRVGNGLNIGDAGIYGAMYLAVNLLSSILTNNAAAVLAFPIAMSAVDQTGVDRVKMAFIIMLSASDYITSFGYQTNLMVYGPGEYSNMDFLRFGAPMQVLLWLSSTAMVSTNKDNWYISWIITFAAFFVIASLRLATNGSAVPQWLINIFSRPSIASDTKKDELKPEVNSWHFRREDLKEFLRVTL